jgi:predicted tellurium resistance membrane protein TerC
MKNMIRLVPLLYIKHVSSFTSIVFNDWTKLLLFTNSVGGLNVEKIFQLALLNVVNDIDNILIIAALLRKNLYEQHPRALFIVKVLAVCMLTLSRTFYVSIIQTLSELPGLHLLTGLIILWIGFRLVMNVGQDEDNRWFSFGATAPLIPIHKMLFIILLTDFVISFDTVFIMAEMTNNIFQALLGLFISLVIAFSLLPLLTRMINTFYWIQIIAGALLVHISILAIAKDALLQKVLNHFFQATNIINVDKMTLILAFDCMIIVLLIGLNRLRKRTK